MYGPFSSIRLPFRCIRTSSIVLFVRLLTFFLLPSIISVPFSLSLSSPGFPSSFLFVYYLFNVAVAIVIVVVVVVRFVNSAVMPCGEQMYSSCAHTLIASFFMYVACCFCTLWQTRVITKLMVATEKPHTHAYTGTKSQKLQVVEKILQVHTYFSNSLFCTLVQHKNRLWSFVDKIRHISYVM